ncbi:MAG TPA: NADH-quinone oxidoreductase subunit N [Phycisphaerae bacterium]|nr:NADH-quinone oxidoreductase subunit N [Phycisphaerae bacterium]
MEIPVQYLLPEIILIVAACAATLMGLSRWDSVRKLTQCVAATATLLALLVAYFTGLNYPSDAFAHALYFSPNYITLLACAIGFLTVLASWNMPSQNEPTVPDYHYRGEFFGMLLFSIAGVAMIGKVNDLLWMFLALELVSIPTYILVATGRSQIIAQEAGVKYFFLGALAAAIFLFGFSYIYGTTGVTRFAAIHEYFLNHELTPLALIGLLAVIIGVCYKIAAVPMHFYTPDVYQGAATPVTAYLAFAPKAAGMVAIISTLTLINFNWDLRPHIVTPGAMLLDVMTVIAVLTMSVGNVLALLQRNIKRIFAYSSIAHSGYMLIGLVAGPNLAHSPSSIDGVDATLFYLASYALMNLGALAVLVYLQGKADAAEDLDDLAGIAKERPGAALMFAICLFSLIGMPLTVGFLGKLYIIQAALTTGHPYLAVIVVINAAVAAGYYLRIVAAMYLRDPLYPFSVRKAFPIRITAIICSAAVVAFFFAPSFLIRQNLAKSPIPDHPVITAAATPHGNP